MSKFSEAIERAHTRAEVTEEGDVAWSSMREFYRAEAVKRRQAHRLGHIVSWAIDRKERDTKPWNQRAERELLDRATMEDTLVQFPRMTEFDVHTMTKDGWVLCEKVDELSGRTIEIEGQTIDLPRINGLLLTTYGDIYTYGADLNPLYPTLTGPDAWGNVRNNLYNGDPRIVGDVTQLHAPLADGSNVNEYDGRLRAISGTLDLNDLLAGLVVRHDLDPQQFEPHRWTLQTTGPL